MSDNTNLKLDTSIAGYSENILKNMFISAPAGICILESENHIYKFINPAYQKLIGNRDVINKNIREALPELESQGIYQLLDTVYSTGKPFNGNEVPISLEIDNNIRLMYFNFVYQPILDENNKSIGITVFAYDVTELVLSRKKAEQLSFELEKSNQLLKENEELINLELKNKVQEIESERNTLYELFINAPAVICVFKGPKHTYEFVNPEYSRLYGNRRLVGKPIAEANPELNGQGFFELLDNVYDTGKPYIGNEVLASVDKYNDGNLHNLYFNFVYQPILDQFGKSTGITVFAFDITQQVLERKKAEHLNDEVKISEKKYKNLSESLEITVEQRTKELLEASKKIEYERNKLENLFMNAPASICILESSEHIYTFTNKMFKKIFGNREIIGKSVRQAMPELEGQGFFELLDNVYRTGIPFVGNEMLINQDINNDGKLVDNYLNFIYEPFYSANNEIQGITVFAFDVTSQVIARKNAEDLSEQLRKEQQALKESEQNFRVLADTIPNFVWTANPDGYVDYYNYKFLDFVGLTFEEMKGWGWKYTLHPEDVQETIDIWEVCINTGKPYQREYRYRKASDGKYYWFIARALPVLNENNEIIKWFGTCTEIEEQKQTEQKLANANEELERFNYIASHDLQSPLRTIASYSRLLQNRYTDKLDESANDFMEIIIKASISMKTLIDDLLNFSKVGKYEIVYKQVNLNKIIEEVIELNKTFIEENNALISYQELPVIMAEHTQIFQIFQNLISNGLKYRKENVNPSINISAERLENKWIFTITDNGIGIESQYFKRIFEPFKRLHNSNEYLGSGIGLATVKKIIELYGGKIWVESELNSGSTFFFTIPFKELII